MVAQAHKDTCTYNLTAPWLIIISNWKSPNGHAKEDSLNYGLPRQYSVLKKSELDLSVRSKYIKFKKQMMEPYALCDYYLNIF